MSGGRAATKVPPPLPARAINLSHYGHHGGPAEPMNAARAAADAESTRRRIFIFGTVLCAVSGDKSQAWN